MDRKNFIGSVFPLVASLQSFSTIKSKPTFKALKHIPPYLQKGDTIGICCPSGYISSENIQSAVNKMKEWGFLIKVGNTVGARSFMLGGTDEERTRDLQSMLDDDSIKAIMFARGGYGAVRIIDNINFEKFASFPKWLIGFSDATIFHTHLNSNYGIASIHSKMCNSFPMDWSTADSSQVESIETIKRCLTGEPMSYSVPGNEHNRIGTGEGVLIGGNLSLLQNVAGTPSDFDTRGKILFIEDVDEYLYNIDRMLWNLLRRGKFHKLKGLIIGGFNKLKPDDPGEEYGHTIYEMIMEKVKEYTFPVCFDFPVGHQKYNVALKCGIRHKLFVDQNNVNLEQS